MGMGEQYEYGRWQYRLLNLLEKGTLIRKVVLGEGITGINDASFKGLEDLKAFEVAESNPYLSAEEGVLFNKEKTARCTILRQGPAIHTPSRRASKRSGAARSPEISFCGRCAFPRRWNASATTRFLPAASWRTLRSRRACTA